MARKFYTVAISNSLNNNTPSESTALSFDLHKDDNIEIIFPVYCEKKGNVLKDLVMGKTYKIYDDSDLDKKFYASEIYMRLLDEINPFDALRVLELVDKTLLTEYIQKIIDIETRCQMENEKHINEGKKF